MLLCPGPQRPKKNSGRTWGIVPGWCGLGGPGGRGGGGPARHLRPLRALTAGGWWPAAVVDNHKAQRAILVDRREAEFWVLTGGPGKRQGPETSPARPIPSGAWRSATVEGFGWTPILQRLRCTYH